MTADIQKMLEEFESNLVGQFSSLLLQSADEIAPAREFIEGASRIVSNIDPGNAIVLSEPFPDLRTKTLNYQLHMQSFESVPISISIQQQGNVFYINDRGPETVEQLAGDLQALALEYFRPKSPPRATEEEQTPES